MRKERTRRAPVGALGTAAKGARQTSRQGTRRAALEGNEKTRRDAELCGMRRAVISTACGGTKNVRKRKNRNAEKQTHRKIRKTCNWTATVRGGHN